MPSPTSSPSKPHPRWTDSLLAAAAGLIAAATVVAYLPAVRGGFIWDDDAHVTKPALRSTHGLYRIWFDVGATQQYYPLLHSAFWIEHKLWGDSPVGYHLVNIALHAAAAVLVMLILRRLLLDKGVAWADPAAFLTAAVFALHPVHVESVAWITEQKNTLSAVFYLAAMLTYLCFDRTRRRGLYALSTALFALSLLSKPVTVTLPAALLVIFWWLRGRVLWKRDVVPLLPWFVMSIVSGLFAAWVEHSVIGADAEVFDFSAIQRFMLAGRVVWFYLYKLVWPAELIFMYPRWTVDPSAWWQWLFPLCLIALLIVLLVSTNRSRAPLAALLFFIGSLFPVLGFFNVYLYVYTFVADHFQFLASLGPIALVCGAIVAMISRLASRTSRAALLLVLPTALGARTFHQCRIYDNIQTSYEAVIQRNPTCWVAYNNLAALLTNTGRFDEAIQRCHDALRIRPDYADAYNNLGVALNAVGRPDDAAAACRQALRLQPAHPVTLKNLAVALTETGRFEEAIDCLHQALSVDPNNSVLHRNLGATLQAASRLPEAITEYRQAVELDPTQPGAQLRLDLALAETQTPEKAIAAYEQVLRASPDSSAAHFALAAALEKTGWVDEAAEHYQRVLRINPNQFPAHQRLAVLHARTGRLAEAIPHFEQAARLRPGNAEVQKSLAVAYASAGRSADALHAAARALDLARASGRASLIHEIEGVIEFCRARAASTAPSR